MKSIKKDLEIDSFARAYSLIKSRVSDKVDSQVRIQIKNKVCHQTDINVRLQIFFNFI